MALKYKQIQDASDSLKNARCSTKWLLRRGQFDAQGTPPLRGARRGAVLISTARGPAGESRRRQARPESEDSHPSAAASLPPARAKTTDESHNRQSTTILYYSEAQ